MTNKSLKAQFSLRNLYAGLAMLGYLSSGIKDRSQVAGDAFQQADAMLSILNSGQSRVDWSKAPEWAIAHAVDSNTLAHWYEVEPELDADEWVVTSLNSRTQKAPNFGFQGDWTQSLTKRGAK